MRVRARDGCGLRGRSHGRRLDGAGARQSHHAGRRRRRAEANTNLNAFDGPRGSDARLLALGLAMEQLLKRTPPPAR